MKQFTHSWNLPCCQCTKTCSHVFSIQNYLCMEWAPTAVPIHGYDVCTYYCKTAWHSCITVHLTVTRTTRTPAFWGYPPPPHDYPYYWVILDPYWVKRRQSQSYKFKEFAELSNFWILKQMLHATHLLKLLDKMCKYEMYPTSFVEVTERTRFCPQMDGQTDRRTDDVKPVYPPFNFVEAGGIKIYPVLEATIREDDVKIAMHTNSKDHDSFAWMCNQ